MKKGWMPRRFAGGMGRGAALLEGCQGCHHSPCCLVLAVPSPEIPTVDATVSAQSSVRRPLLQSVCQNLQLFPRVRGVVEEGGGVGIQGPNTRKQYFLQTILLQAANHNSNTYRFLVQTQVGRRT